MGEVHRFTAACDCPLYALINNAGIMAQPELVTTPGGREIKDYGLAEIEDYIDTYDCIVAGDLVPIWRSGKKNWRSWNGRLRMEAYALCGMDSNLG